MPCLHARLLLGAFTVWFQFEEMYLCLLSVEQNSAVHDTVPSMFLLALKICLKKLFFFFFYFGKQKSGYM